MKRTGFTLIELLVVIAIIVLVIALTITALRKSRAQARAVVCRSNVNQLAMALIMYADENETFPFGFSNAASDGADHLGDARKDRMGHWWLNDIENYVGKPDSEEQVFCCPSKKLDNPTLQDNILWGNYGVNRSICRTSPASLLYGRDLTGMPLGLDGIPHPGKTLLIVDSGYSLVNWWHATDVPPMPLGTRAEDRAYVPGLEINKGRDLLPEQQQDAIAGRHPSKTVNVGFADGQVTPMKAQDLFVENSADTYKNKTPLWVPK